MRKSAYILAAFVMATFWMLGTNAAGETAPELLGRIVIDVSANGEAWYVSPQSQMRVYLGRPEEALERLKAHAVYVNFANIARLAVYEGEPHDADYANSVAGYVLAPSDLIGAAWYVDPATGLRKRLATASDAWEVMRSGTAATGEQLDLFAIEDLPGSRYSTAVVRAVKTADLVELDDGREVRLLSLEVPSNEDLQAKAMNHLTDTVVGREVVLEADVQTEDESGTEQRYMHAGDLNVNLDLVRRGLAFHNFSFPNFRHAEQLIVAGLDAMRLGNGFWEE